MTKRIVKVGLCLMRDGAVLLARSKGDRHFQIPGGKIEPGESDIEALTREVMEELSVALDPARIDFMAAFEAPAAGRPDTLLELRLYVAATPGEPRASSEIEALHWQPLTGQLAECSEMVRDHILPYLRNEVVAP